jgi:ferrous iron transport protein A
MFAASNQPLTCMKPRQKAFIVALTGGREVQDRLVSMGLYVGSEVELICPCTGTDGPAVVATGETRLAIGYGMASSIMVAVDPW